MGHLQPYRAEKFSGGATSYGGQGICSFCHDKCATWMGMNGAVWLAYCVECARFVRPCTCQKKFISPASEEYLLIGVGDCPIHGLCPPGADNPGRKRHTVAVSARLSPMEQAILGALCLGNSQTDVIREGIRLVWELRGAASLCALAALEPDKAERLRALIDGYDHDDPAWTRTLNKALDTLERDGTPDRDPLPTWLSSEQAHADAESNVV